MTEQQKQKYAVEFTLTMPGQTRSSTYPIVVEAENRGEALAAAEKEYTEIVSQYDVRVKAIAQKVAPGTQSQGSTPQ